MLSVKFIAVCLAVASYARAALPVSPSVLTNNTTNATSSASLVANATSPANITTLPDSSAATNASSVTNPTSPGGQLPSGQVLGDTSSGQCLCPAPPTCAAAGTPPSPVSNVPSVPGAGAPSSPGSNSPGVVSPIDSTPPSQGGNSSTAPPADNSTSSAVTNSVPIMALFTAGALAIAV